MDKEVLRLMWLKTRMKKRFALIHRWLKDAEQNYSKDRKTEGELNLLLAQAEVRRAWEVSRQEGAANEDLQKLRRNSGFTWKLLGGLCLSIFLTGLFFFHFPFQSKVTHSSPGNHSSFKPTANLTTIDFNSPQPVVKPEKTEEVKKKEHLGVETKEAAYPEKIVTPRKNIKVEERPVTTDEVTKPIQVDVVDLVQEAEKSLYQPAGGQVQH